MNRKILDVEVLRGLAVLLVCVEHMNSNLFSWTNSLHKMFFGWTGMWSGVDLFLVISGFVITRDLLPKLQATSNTHDFLKTSVAFWIRRAWRLIPSAWLWLFVILMGCVFFNDLGAWGSFRANVEATLAAIFNVANLRFWAIYGSSETGASFPYWSLSLEEQFYLIFPFVILFSGKKLPFVLAMVVLAQLIFPRSGLGVILRTDALAIGALLAIFSSTSIYQLFNPVFLSSKLNKYLVLFICMVGLVFIGGEDMHLPIEFSMVAFISAILVFVASYDQNYVMGQGMIKNCFVWIGARSYAIYLIHIPAYYTTRELWFRFEPVGTVFNGSYYMEFLLTAFLLIVICAELNYRFVEIPLRRRGAEIADKYMASKGL
jgi:peptidoglycan/LPS O-acetylase OafA/YrhL